jgi:putative two-component system response regulator
MSEATVMNMNEEKKNSILIADDERSNISLLRNMLNTEYTVYAAIDGQGAIDAAEKFLPDIILLDIIMPEMDGYEVIGALKSHEKMRDIPVIFITGLDNQEAEEKGLAMGAADFIPKPFNSAIVKLRVQNQMILLNRTRALIEQAKILRQRTEKLLRLQGSMASVLANMVESRDKLTGKHIEQTAVFLKILLDAMIKNGLYADETANWNTDIVVMSSRLHDIGKITVSDVILNKPGKFTPGEFETMKTHAIEGEKIIDDIIAESGDEDFLHNAKLFAGSHHERWDGTGYPRGLKGEGIPLQGRIMAIADVYDALVSDRPYKQAFTHEKAMEIILEGKAKHFDPKIADVFFSVADLFAGVAVM